MNEPTCFGMNDEGQFCRRCKMEKQCKAFQATDGMEMAAAGIESLVAMLPDQEYLKVDSYKALMELLADPTMQPIPPGQVFPTPVNTQGKVSLKDI